MNWIRVYTFAVLLLSLVFSKTAFSYTYEIQPLEDFISVYRIENSQKKQTRKIRVPKGYESQISQVNNDPSGAQYIEGTSWKIWGQCGPWVLLTYGPVYYEKIKKDYSFDPRVLMVLNTKTMTLHRLAEPLSFVGADAQSGRLSELAFSPDCKTIRGRMYDFRMPENCFTYLLEKEIYLEDQKVDLEGYYPDALEREKKKNNRGQVYLALKNPQGEGETFFHVPALSYRNQIKKKKLSLLSGKKTLTFSFHLFGPYRFGRLTAGLKESPFIIFDYHNHALYQVSSWKKLARALNTRGFRAYKKKDYDESLKNFEKATLVDPDYALAHFNLACLYALGNHSNEAIESLGRAISLKPSKYRKKAKKDSDFTSLQEDPRFLALVYPP